MPQRLIVMRVAYDSEARVWWRESTDLEGLNAWAPSLEEFRDVLPPMVADLIEIKEPSWKGVDIAIEIIAVGRERINIRAAA